MYFESVEWDFASPPMLMTLYRCVVNQEVCSINLVCQLFYSVKSIISQLHNSKFRKSIELPTTYALNFSFDSKKHTGFECLPKILKSLDD